MKRNVLVFPCGSEIGLEVFRALKYTRFFHLIGGSSVDDHGKFVFDDYIGGLPMVNDPKLIDTLEELVSERSIDAIYPTTDMVAAVLKEYEEQLKCKVISSNKETTEICLSKKLTYDRLRDIVPIQKIYLPGNIPEDEYPVFIKPMIGHSSIGTRVVLNSEELAVVESGCMILEYLPGEEYTVDCFTDRNGELLYYGARQRRRIKSGISVDTFFVEDQGEFKPLIEAINDHIKFEGAWFAQFKRDKNGILCLMEIAARLGGSSALSRAIGVNFPLLSLFNAFGYDVNIKTNNYKVELDRALNSIVRFDIDFDTIYVDYDDCLIFDKAVINAELVSFLYSMINKGKKIILLSKHEGDLVQELHDFRLSELFDEIIQIDQTDSKTKYIKEKKAIFIDDSFIERNRIAESVGIPVFSPDMVDLMRR